jgi:hypothetical protein
VRRIVILVLVTAAAVTTTAVALGARSPKAELAAIKAAALTKTSVHDVSVNSSPGYTITTVSDVARTKGVQVLTVTHQESTGHGVVRIIGSHAYIKGNLFMLTFWGFERAQAKNVVGKWIYIPQSSPAYQPFAEGATFRSFLALIWPATADSIVTSGTLIGVRGTATYHHEKVKETLFAPAHQKPLPTKEIATYPGHPGKDVTTISRWNEKVRVPVPMQAIPIEAVTG